MPRRSPPSRRRSAPSPPPRAGAEPSRSAHLRVSNHRLLLRLLREHSPCSKADLVRLSGLTAPTVSLAAAHLSSLGLIEPTGERVSSGGRPPAMLRFRPRHGFVAAADVGGTRLRMLLADLDGVPVARWKTHIPATQKHPEGIVALMRDGLSTMAAAAGALVGTTGKRAAGRVLHLTAGAPGITDVDRGVVLSAPNLTRWVDVPFRALLEHGLGLSATVENDTNLAALGEHARGVAQGAQNVLFLAIGTGVGAGIVLRGALHHGAHWSAGEIGYLPVLGEPREPVRLCETGQLERSIGGAGIEQRWQALLARTPGPHSPDLFHLRAPRIFDRADAGDPLALALVESTARILADALSTLSLVVNPELVVLGGGVGSHPALLRSTERLLQQNEFALPRLALSSLGTEAQLFGAVALSLDRIEDRLLC